MDKFNINVNMYKKKDIERFLLLPENYNYFTVDNAVKLKIKLITDNDDLTPEEKKRMVAFVIKLREKITKKLSIPPNYIKQTEMKPHFLNKNTFLEEGEFFKPFDTTDENQFESTIASTDQINRFKREIVTKQFSIDTRFRRDYFNTRATDFTIHLANPINNVVSMKLSSLEFPNVMHAMSEIDGTNGFKVKISGEPDSKLISFPSGNYTSSELVNLLNGDVNFDNSGNYTLLNDPDLNLRIDINISSYRTTITNTNFFDFTMDFTNTKDGAAAPPMKSLGWMLGFRRQKYSGASFYTSEGAADLGGNRYFFLCVNDFQSTIHELVTVVYENSFMQKNILARIPLRQGKGVILFDDTSDKITKKRDYLSPIKIKKLHITLIDVYGEIIRFNNMDYSFALEFDVLYDK